MSRHATPAPPMRLPGLGFVAAFLGLGLAGPLTVLAEPVTEALRSAPPPPVAAPDTEQPT